MGLNEVWPLTTQVNAAGHLEIGGCDAVELVREFGTPLYAFDEATLRRGARACLSAAGGAYPEVRVIYACKAFINIGLARLLSEEGLGFDVVSGGELYAVKQAGAPLEGVYFHGNNKSAEELRLALDWGVGRVVVDSFHELGLLEAMAAEAGGVDIMLRLSPGVEAHTHDYLKTGILDSKFGFPIATGQAEQAVVQALGAARLKLVGLHCHIGTQIFQLRPYQEAVDIVFAFAGAMARRYGLEMREFSPGGGWGIRYLAADDPPPLEEAVAAVAQAVRAAAEREGLPLPRLVLEPGRSIVGPAGVALYTIGARKEIPELRCYISVDGGMGDNIRPALYGAKYQALVANKPQEPPSEVVTIAGKYCESGDVLIRDIVLPPLEAGDILAVPAAGAYCLAMASNYNLALRPAVVLLKDGRARLIRRRETYEDLLRCDTLE